MDIFTTRRERLKDLIADDFKGNQSSFSKHTKIKATQVNRWLSTTASDPRRITEPSARKIEIKCGKPPPLARRVARRRPCLRREPGKHGFPSRRTSVAAIGYR